jgi:hypothetical protein
MPVHLQFRCSKKLIFTFCGMLGIFATCSGCSFHRDNSSAALSAMSTSATDIDSSAASAVSGDGKAAGSDFDSPLCGYVPDSERCNLERDNGKPCKKEGDECGMHCNPWGCTWLICKDGVWSTYQENNAPETVEARSQIEEMCKKAAEGKKCEGRVACRPDDLDCGGCVTCTFLQCVDGRWKNVVTKADPEECSYCKHE